MSILGGFGIRSGIFLYSSQNCMSLRVSFSWLRLSLRFGKVYVSLKNLKYSLSLGDGITVKFIFNQPIVTQFSI